MPPRTDESGWWWDRTKHPVLWECVVALLALGLLAWAAADPHGFFQRDGWFISGRAVGAIIASLLLLVVIAGRLLNWLRHSGTTDMRDYGESVPRRQIVESRSEKKYSTGFKLFLVGWGIIGLALLLSRVWGPLIWLVGLGVPGVWFKYPSDWRKTWPQDFPITSRIVDRVRGRRRNLLTH